MAAGPIRFRCSQCQQLLGASPAKAGTVVACPRCSADNFVPFEDQSIPPPPPRPSPPPARAEGEVPAEADPERTPGIDPELLAIRPEDIRVEPGVRASTPLVEPPAQSEAPDESDEHEEDEGYSIEDDPSPQPAPTVTATPVRARPASSLAAGPIAPERPSVAAEPIVPPIRIDEPLRQSRAPQPVILRPRDLIVPRSLVALWSILVLVAVGFAFVSGLLIGHYVWGVH